MLGFATVFETRWLLLPILTNSYYNILTLTSSLISQVCSVLLPTSLCCRWAACARCRTALSMRRPTNVTSWVWVQTCPFRRTSAPQVWKWKCDDPNDSIIAAIVFFFFFETNTFLFALQNSQCWWTSLPREAVISQPWLKMDCPQFISSPSVAPTRSPPTGVSVNYSNL